MTKSDAPLWKVLLTIVDGDDVEQYRLKISWLKAMDICRQAIELTDPAYIVWLESVSDSQVVMKCNAMIIHDTYYENCFPKPGPMMTYTFSGVPEGPGIEDLLDSLEGMMLDPGSPYRDKFSKVLDDLMVSGVSP